MQHQTENKMNTTLGIKNFRLFDANGVEVNIKPLTILTGCNSSGKSSVVKAIILLNEFLRGVRNDHVGQEPRLEFNRKPLSLLGNFDSILNRESAVNGDRVITLSYDLDDPFLGRGINVEMSFAASKNDIRKEGFLKDVFVRNKDGVIVFHGSGYSAFERLFPDPHWQEYDISYGERWIGDVVSSSCSLKRRYFVYSCVCQALDYFNKAYASFHVMGETSEEEAKDVHDKVMDFLREMKEKEGGDIVMEAVDFYANERGNDEYGKLFKVDGSCVEMAMEADILTYLPILRDLDAIGKNDFRTRFIEMTGIKEGAKIPRVKRLVERIISEFEDGGYERFSDYYRDLENRSLDRMLAQLSGIESLLMEEYELYLKGIDPVSFSAKPLFVDDGDEETARYDFFEDMEVSLSSVFYLLTSMKDHPNDDDFVESVTDRFSGEEHRDHKLLRDFLVFRDAALRNVFLTDVCDNLQYVGSNRIDVKRLYSFESQDNFGHTVSEYFEAIRLCNENGRTGAGDFIDKWIREFGIGYHFGIESVENGVGLVLKIYQDENDKEGRLLADYGYGISQLISVLLEIQTAIVKVKTCHRNDAVDYEQRTLSILKAVYFVQSDATATKIPISIAIEEPEIHLHPKYQSLLADMFLDAYLNYGIQFLIETHSEYLIRKLQTFVGKKIVPPDSISILYAEDSPEPGEERIRRIGIKDDGRLDSAFGSGFFDEADSLAMNLLMIKGGMA